MKLTFKQYLAISNLAEDSDQDIIEEAIYNLLDEDTKAVMEVFGKFFGKTPSSAEKAKARADARAAFKDLSARIERGEKLPPDLMKKYKELESAQIGYAKAEKTLAALQANRSTKPAQSNFRRGSLAAGRAAEREWIANLSSAN